MSFQVTEAFLMSYGSNVRLLAQQKASRLRGAVTVEPGVRGKRHYMDYVGSVSASKITNRHGDSPLNSTPHSRRAIDLAGYDTGDLIDDIDKDTVDFSWWTRPPADQGCGGEFPSRDGYCGKVIEVKTSCEAIYDFMLAPRAQPRGSWLGRSGRVRG